MAAPTITALPSAPSRGSPGDAFSDTSDSFVAALVTLRTEINAFGTWLNSNSLTSYAWGDGTVGAPSIGFADDSDTGLYRPTNNRIGVALGGTEYYRFAPLGLGIGEATPAKNLHITDSNPTIRLEDAEGGYCDIYAPDGLMRYRADDGNTQSGSAHVFEVDGAEVYRADGTGVGIGENSPSEKLHVAGSAIFEKSAPALIMLDTGGTAGYQGAAILNDGDGLSVQTRNDSGSFIATDYLIQRDGSGATLHQWSIGGSPAGRWNGTGLAVGTTNVLKPFYVYEDADSDITRMNAAHASYANDILELSSARAGSSAFNFLKASSNAFGDNEFLLSGDGNGTCDGSWTGGGADYAEYFEWADGNPNAEDRRGISVVLDGDKIREAAKDEEPIGVISGNPSVIGDGDIGRWKGKYLRDDFGSYVWEDFEVLEWTGADGKPVSYATDAVPEGTEVPGDAAKSAHKRRALNPDYDPESPYIARADRPEWDTVGLMGKLRLRKGQATGSQWTKMRDVSADVEEWLVR